MNPLRTDPSGWPASRENAIPPLEPGDRLTRDEFERRYEAMPHLKKAELIEGVVYMPSPVRAYRDGTPRSHLITWLGTYRATTPGVETADNATVRLDLDNEPQPDAMLIIDPGRGGQVRISDDDYMSKGRPNSWPRLPPAVSASTDTPSSTSTAAAPFRNISSGGFWTGRLTGLSWPVELTSGWRPTATGFSKAASSPASGSTGRPCSPAMWRGCSPYFRRAWQLPSTANSWPGWPGSNGPRPANFDRGPGTAFRASRPALVRCGARIYDPGGYHWRPDLARHWARPAVWYFRARRRFDRLRNEANGATH